MKLRVPAQRVYDSGSLPEYEWETYQRGFLGILNNAYNQSCNAGTHKLGYMNEIASDFRELGGGSWQDFVRYYVREHDGHRRIHESVQAMADNIQHRTEAVGGAVPRDRARFWARKYIYSMLTNTYRGFCSETTAIRVVANELDLPWSARTTQRDEQRGIDGYIGGTSSDDTYTVQVKPVTHLGLDLNDCEADYVITYTHEDDEFVFDVADDIVPEQNVFT